MFGLLIVLFSRFGLSSPGRQLGWVDDKPTKAGTWEISDMPNHDKLSALASTSKETVARALSQLLQAEVTRRSPGKLEVLDLARLKHMATEV